MGDASPLNGMSYSPRKSFQTRNVESVNPRKIQSPDPPSLSPRTRQILSSYYPYHGQQFGRKLSPASMSERDSAVSTATSNSESENLEETKQLDDRTKKVPVTNGFFRRITAQDFSLLTGLNRLLPGLDSDPYNQKKSREKDETTFDDSDVPVVTEPTDNRATGNNPQQRPKSTAARARPSPRKVFYHSIDKLKVALQDLKIDMRPNKKDLRISTDIEDDMPPPARGAGSGQHAFDGHRISPLAHKMRSKHSPRTRNRDRSKSPRNHHQHKQYQNHQNLASSGDTDDSNGAGISTRTTRIRIRNLSSGSNPPNETADASHPIQEEELATEDMEYEFPPPVLPSPHRVPEYQMNVAILPDSTITVKMIDTKPTFGSGNGTKEMNSNPLTSVYKLDSKPPPNSSYKSSNLHLTGQRVPRQAPNQPKPPTNPRSPRVPMRHSIRIPSRSSSRGSSRNSPRSPRDSPRRRQKMLDLFGAEDIFLPTVTAPNYKLDQNETVINPIFNPSPKANITVSGHMFTRGYNGRQYVSEQNKPSLLASPTGPTSSINSSKATSSQKREIVVNMEEGMRVINEYSREISDSITENDVDYEPVVIQEGQNYHHNRGNHHRSVRVNGSFGSSYWDEEVKTPEHGSDSHDSSLFGYRRESVKQVDTHHEYRLVETPSGRALIVLESNETEMKEMETVNSATRKSWLSPDLSSSGSRTRSSSMFPSLKVNQNRPPGRDMIIQDISMSHESNTSKDHVIEKEPEPVEELEELSLEIDDTPMVARSDVNKRSGIASSPLVAQEKDTKGVTEEQPMVVTSPEKGIPSKSKPELSKQNSWTGDELGSDDKEVATRRGSMPLPERSPVEAFSPTYPLDFRIPPLARDLHQKDSEGNSIHTEQTGIPMIGPDVVESNVVEIQPPVTAADLDKKSVMSIVNLSQDVRKIPSDDSDHSIKKPMVKAILKREDIQEGRPGSSLLQGVISGANKSETGSVDLKATVALVELLGFKDKSGDLETDLSKPDEGTKKPRRVTISETSSADNDELEAKDRVTPMLSDRLRAHKGPDSFPFASIAFAAITLSRAITAWSRRRALRRRSLNIKRMSMQGVDASFMLNSMDVKNILDDDLESTLDMLVTKKSYLLSNQNDTRKEIDDWKSLFSNPTQPRFPTKDEKLELEEKFAKLRTITRQLVEITDMISKVEKRFSKRKKTRRESVGSSTTPTPTHSNQGRMSLLRWADGEIPSSVPSSPRSSSQMRSSVDMEPAAPPLSPRVPSPRAPSPRAPTPSGRRGSSRLHNIDEVLSRSQTQTPSIPDTLRRKSVTLVTQPTSQEELGRLESEIACLLTIKEKLLQEKAGLKAAVSQFTRSINLKLRKKGSSLSEIDNFSKEVKETAMKWINQQIFEISEEINQIQSHMNLKNLTDTTHLTIDAIGWDMEAEPEEPQEAQWVEGGTIFDNFKFIRFKTFLKHINFSSSDFSANPSLIKMLQLREADIVRNVQNLNRDITDVQLKLDKLYVKREGQFQLQGQLRSELEAYMVNMITEEPRIPSDLELGNIDLALETFSLVSNQLGKTRGEILLTEEILRVKKRNLFRLMDGASTENEESEVPTNTTEI